LAVADDFLTTDVILNHFGEKRVARKCRSLPKFLTAQKALVYGRQPRCRYKCVHPTFAQMASLPFAPKISLFVLKL
jgi:hypothetical protein